MQLEVRNHCRFAMTPHSQTDPLPVLRRAAELVAPHRMWLGAGSLLGMHRDGGFIPHDTDIDFMLGCPRSSS